MKKQLFLITLLATLGCNYNFASDEDFIPATADQDVDDDLDQNLDTEKIIGTKRGREDFADEDQQTFKRIKKYEDIPEDVKQDDQRSLEYFGSGYQVNDTPTKVFLSFAKGALFKLSLDDSENIDADKYNDDLYQGFLDRIKELQDLYKYQMKREGKDIPRTNNYEAMVLQFVLKEEFDNLKLPEEEREYTSKLNDVSHRIIREQARSNRLLFVLTVDKLFDLIEQGEIDPSMCLYFIKEIYSWTF